MDPAKQRRDSRARGVALHTKRAPPTNSRPTRPGKQAKKVAAPYSQDRHHMAEIGRVGGQARGRKQRAAQQSAASETEKPEEEESGKDEAAVEGERPTRRLPRDRGGV